MIEDIIQNNEFRHKRTIRNRGVSKFIYNKMDLNDQHWSSAVLIIQD